MATIFADRLESFGDRPALIEADGTVVAYRALAALADDFSTEALGRLPTGIERPLVLIETASTPAAIAAYLGALRAGWPVILAAEGATAADPRIRDTYRPNLVVTAGADGAGLQITPFSPEPAAMHPQLAVLLSTSGTTGAPKLVRLSRQNIEANARSIAEYLGIDETERAITTLSFHYSYGMSVLNTHLAMGASLVLTEASLVDERFYEIFERNGATSLALVPFQFELLESRGFADRRLYGLRTITQAGGRLSEPMIRRFAALGRRDGWRLFVMYGQTEASPRIAYLPPEDVERHAGAIGRAIPGGRLEIVGADGRPVTAPGIAGELVYEGPNVMMGYAVDRAGLALPLGPARLATGDVAEWLPNGYARIVGRLSRFVKLFGLRISLDEIETRLSAEGVAAYAVGDDEGITVLATGDIDPPALARRLIAHYGLTPETFAVLPIAEVPLLSSGKVDYRTLQAIAGATRPEPASPPADLVEALQAALRTEEIDTSLSFAELGGDSLAFLEIQIFLADRLGAAPAGWETMPIVDLAALEPARRQRFTAVAMDVLLRVAAISSVIALHATQLPTAGGAHILLVLTGFSLARFQKARLLAGETGRVIETMLLPILAAYYLILTGMHHLMQPVDPEWLLLLGNFDQDIHPRGITPYWFVCLYVQILLLVSLLFASARLRRAIGRRPLSSGLLLVLGLAVLGEASGLGAHLGDLRLRHPLFALQLVALGWAIFHARDHRTRAAVLAVAALDLAFVWSTTGSILAILSAAVLALALVDRIPLPGPVARLALEIGRSSMYLYLAHPIVISLLVAAAPAGRALHFVLAYAISYAIARSLVALADRQSRLRSHLARLNISAIRRRAPTGA